MKKRLKRQIKENVAALKNVFDCTSVTVGENKVLFFQVVDSKKGKEYFIELNNLIAGTLEPCAPYNVSSPCGDMDALITTVSDYLKAVM